MDKAKYSDAHRPIGYLVTDREQRKAVWQDRRMRDRIKRARIAYQRAITLAEADEIGHHWDDLAMARVTLFNLIEKYYGFEREEIDRYLDKLEGI